MSKNISQQHQATFDNIRHEDENGNEYWLARRELDDVKLPRYVCHHMGSTELAANLFRATQTEEKLRRDQVQGKAQANQTHFDVGQKVRQTIDELGGTMPENLPTPDTSIRQLETVKKKQLKNTDEGK